MAYNSCVKNLNKTQLDYTAFGAAYQLRLPLDIEIIIPKNDSVRLLDAVISSLDLSCLFSTYERIRRIQYPPSILLKVLVYAYSKHIYFSRDIETACRENINFMFLLQNNPPPDHNTIARFRRDHLSFLSDEIQKKLTDLLIDLGEVSFSDSAVFIDGIRQRRRSTNAGNAPAVRLRKSASKAKAKSRFPKDRND